MPSRETQALILKVALELFNEHRSASVSTNRIAEACEISKGNLNYHFRTKQDIILALFADITVEMNRAWYEDHRNPTMDHMGFMFAPPLRQFGGTAFSQGPCAGGIIRRDFTDKKIALLITSTWVLSDHWLNHIETTGQDVDEAAFRL